MPYRELERHTTPDRLLTLVVHINDTDGDLTVGFEDVHSHIHGDSLAVNLNSTPQAAVRAYVDDIINSRKVIVLSYIDGALDDAWITDDPDKDESRYAFANETLHKRLWDGSPYRRQTI